jgi:S-DNA-T family DNA segregation ATPase FtsK/SpoIIIE
MLYHPLGAPKPVRVQGAFVSTREVEDVVSFVKNTGTPDYSEETIDEIEMLAEKKMSGSDFGGDDESDDDPMLYDALRVAVDAGKVSTSMLQTRLKLGYNRAARIIEQLEERNLIGPSNGAKPREVLIDSNQFSEMMMRRE